MQLSVTLLQVMGLHFQGPTNSVFVRLLSHQPAVLFSQNKPATSNQPVVLFSQNKSAPAISHQPNEQTEGGGRRKNAENMSQGDEAQLEWVSHHT
jgi:hypothetical protein